MIDRARVAPHPMTLSTYAIFEPHEFTCRDFSITARPRPIQRSRAVVFYHGAHNEQHNSGWLVMSCYCHVEFVNRLWLMSRGARFAQPVNALVIPGVALVPYSLDREVRSPPYMSILMAEHGFTNISELVTEQLARFSMGLASPREPFQCEIHHEDHHYTTPSGAN